MYDRCNYRCSNRVPQSHRLKTYVKLYKAIHVNGGERLRKTLFWPPRLFTCVSAIYTNRWTCMCGCKTAPCLSMHVTTGGRLLCCVLMQPWCNKWESLSLPKLYDWYVQYQLVIGESIWRYMLFMVQYKTHEDQVCDLVFIFVGFKYSMSSTWSW